MCVCRASYASISACLALCASCLVLLGSNLCPSLCMTHATSIRTCKAFGSVDLPFVFVYTCTCSSHADFCNFFTRCVNVYVHASWLLTALLRPSFLCFLLSASLCPPSYYYTYICVPDTAVYLSLCLEQSRFHHHPSPRLLDGRRIHRCTDCRIISAW